MSRVADRRWALAGLVLPFFLLPAGCGGAIDAPAANTGESQRDWDWDELLFCEGGCTYTQGWWKNHNKYETNRNQMVPWPAPLSEDTVWCGQTWLEILNTPPKGDAWYILAHQWIAARLNFADEGPNACHPPLVLYVAKQAQYLLDQCEIPADQREKATRFADLLADFNEGKVGPGHCDNDDDDDDDDGGHDYDR